MLLSIALLIKSLPLEPSEYFRGKKRLVSKIQYNIYDKINLLNKAKYNVLKY